MSQLWSGKFDEVNWAFVYFVALLALAAIAIAVGLYWKVTHPTPGRRWFSFSLRTLLAITLGIAFLFGMFVNLNWMATRHFYVHRMRIPVTGERPAPFPIRWFGAPGYEHVILQLSAQMPADDVARVRDLAKRQFPEADIVVTVKE